MMSTKVLVEVLVPATGEKYDVFIPLTIRMGEAVKLISGIVNDLSAGRYQTTDDTILCNADTGYIYDVNTIIAEQQIRNGTRLMLI